MIQLATDSNARRAPAWRPAAAEAKESPLAARRRSGHAWPFISRYGERPEQQEAQPSTRNEQGGS